MQLILTNLIGLVMGIISSLLVWFFLFRRIIPKINFSKHISKIKSEIYQDTFDYRIKYQNYGKRKIIDVNIIVLLRIRGLFKNRPKTWKLIYIETEPEMKYKPRLNNPQNGGNIVRLDLNKTKFFSNSLMPIEIQEKFKSKKLTIEDIFKIGTDRDLEIILIGYDEFSCAKKLISSGKYKYDDKNNPIVEGNFEGKSLEINTGLKTIESSE